MSENTALLSGRSNDFSVYKINNNVAEKNFYALEIDSIAKDVTNLFILTMNISENLIHGGGVKKFQIQTSINLNHQPVIEIQKSQVYRELKYLL